MRLYRRVAQALDFLTPILTYWSKISVFVVFVDSIVV